MFRASHAAKFEKANQLEVEQFKQLAGGSFRDGRRCFSKLLSTCELDRAVVGGRLRDVRRHSGVVTRQMRTGLTGDSVAEFSKCLGKFTR